MARLLAKGKSMVAEEIFLNHHLEDAGIQVIETDLGEWIIQLAHETPSHMVMPAIHKSRQQVASLFEERTVRSVPHEDVQAQVRFARDELRRMFVSADAGMIGANALIAETGSVMLVTNEGNGDLVSTLPRLLIVIAGWEKILPTFADATAQVRLLARSGTGQEIATYSFRDPCPCNDARQRKRDAAAPGRIGAGAADRRSVNDEFVPSAGRSPVHDPSQPAHSAGRVVVLRQRRPDLADDDAFLRFARGLDGFRVESEGDVVTVISPAGWETGARNAIITEQLTAWARATRLGRTTESSGLYRLRRGVRRAPDAAWIFFERLAGVPAEQRQGVLPIPPDFVIELHSPTDSLDERKDKLQAYSHAGVQLAWLIDPSTRTVNEYRPGSLPREYQQPQTMSADPVLPGFVLDLAEVWQAQ